MNPSCPACGSKVILGRFCSNCGANLTGERAGTRASETPGRGRIELTQSELMMLCLTVGIVSSLLTSVVLVALLLAGAFG